MSRAHAAIAELEPYRRKRHFNVTSEPAGGAGASKSRHSFVVQKHAASHLHYDFRLAMDGVLKSWAVPKGPSLDPRQRRLAVHVEDHPLEYASFEGTIPKGQYGGGTVMVWDEGTWQPIVEKGESARQAYERGRLRVRLDGKRLRGAWSLVRTEGAGGKNWLLIKSKDEEALASGAVDAIDAHDTSVVTERTMQEIAGGAPPDKVTHKREKKPKRAASAPHLGRRAAVIKGARAHRMLSSFAPQLATLTAQVPKGDEWLHEIKLDGYRIIALIDRAHDRAVRIMTRSGVDWTHRLQVVVDSVATLPFRSAIVDGELVVVDAKGRSSFQALQGAIKAGHHPRLQLHLFDLPYCEGFDLTAATLLDRKTLLAEALAEASGTSGCPLVYSDHVVGHGALLHDKACGAALEGVVSKQLHSRYVSGRTRTWLKVKCNRRQEFVIVGYTPPEGTRAGFGALLLGYYENGDLVYSGRVGTGFADAALKNLAKRLRAVRRSTSPLAPMAKATAAETRGATWVDPVLVAEVEFSEWTSDGRLRHPVFRGLREDKPAKDIVRESEIAMKTKKPAPLARGAAKSATADAKLVVAGIAVSNPDRVVYPADNVTKRMLAEYYVAVAKWMLPHVQGRPLTLVRCPRGSGEGCFFQKHLTTAPPTGLSEVTIAEKTSKGRYAVIDGTGADAAGLVALVQMGTLEIHTWGCHADHVERPDRLVFDLDPGPDVPWKRVTDAALLVRGLLKEAGMKSFVQTSGGKGLHVVAPLTRSPTKRPIVHPTWNEVRTFCEAVARTLEAHEPERYTAVMSKARRTGRIFVDYLRNARGATSIAPYSTRARPGAAVATPIRWTELGDVASGDAWTVHTVPSRLRSLRGDVWPGYFSIEQGLPDAEALTAPVTPAPVNKKRSSQRLPRTASTS